MSESKYTSNIRYYGSNGDVIVETDGDMQCAHFADFDNLQESDCAFGGTDIDAVANLALAVRDKSTYGSPCIITAAQEMLAVLEKAKALLVTAITRGEVKMSDYKRSVEDIENAISKAKGEVKA